MLKFFTIAFFLSTSLLAGSIKVAVAANMSYAMQEILKEFKMLHPNIKVYITLGGSGKLTTQIRHGAPYQLFLSANRLYPDMLFNEKFALLKPEIYAQGSLVYFSKKRENFTQNSALLLDKKIIKIAIANPKTAPYGKATVEFFKRSGIYEKVVKKLVYAESISQTLFFAMVAADVGIIAKSALFSPKMTHYKKGENWSDINTKFYTPINQAIVLLKKGEENKDVKKLYNFILSKKVKIILNKFGYKVQ